MAFKVHYAFQDNPTPMIVGARHFFLRFKVVKAAPIGMSLETILTLVLLLPVLQGKIVTLQALPAYTLERNLVLFLWIQFRQVDCVIIILHPNRSRPRALTLPPLAQGDHVREEVKMTMEMPLVCRMQIAQ